MPIYLEPLDVAGDLEEFNSVLIVACPICPPMSLAIREKSPFIEFFKRGLKTGAFEDYLKAIRDPLEQRGVRTGVYTAYLPCPTMCLWTKGQRRRFQKRARSYAVAVVLGCDSAAQTASEVLTGSGCRVIQAMQATGVANARLRFRWPLTLDLMDANCVGSGGDVTTQRQPMQVH